MSLWKHEEISFIMEEFFKNGSSITGAQRSFRRHFGKRAAPSRKVILRAVRNFRKTGNIKKRQSPGRPRTVRNEENIKIISATIAQDPQQSTRRLAQVVSLKRSSVQRVLKNDLKLYPYKAQVVQQLIPADKVNRVKFCEWLMEKCTAEQNFMQKLITSDEAHFHLYGHTNKQNCRFWAKENPRILNEKPLHSVRVTVWCALTFDCVIGPFFFEDEQGAAVTVTAERYNHMLTNFFIPELQRLGLISKQLWMQQDGATSHTAHLPMATLRQHFPGRLISRFGDINWPSRSPDLTPPDYFLWGYLKDRVYRNKPQTLQQLKENIRREVATISNALLHRVMRSMFERAEECCRRSGEHLSDVIFKN